MGILHMALHFIFHYTINWTLHYKYVEEHIISIFFAIGCLMFAIFRYLYRRNKKGITAKLDDDLLKFYCNEDTFLMQVTAIELEGAEGQESIMYDITLCELAE